VSRAGYAGEVTETETESIEAPRVRRPWLYIVGHPDPAHRQTVRLLDIGATRIGREEGGVWDVARVSRRHARLDTTASSVRVVDLGSHNGTRVNGQPVQTHPLSDGDVVRFGPIVAVLRFEASPGVPAVGWGGVSAEQRAVAEALEALRAQDGPVLLVGPAGIGKERAARELARSGRPWVVFDARTAVGTVAVSDLFGQSAGAFPGAVERQGAVRRAADGVLVLSDLDAAPRELAGALLRWLDDGAYTPVGGEAPVSSTCRVVATAASLDWIGPALASRFVAVVELPPLARRRQDVAVHAYRVRADLPARVVEALMLHDWPGNVRELERWLQRQAASGRAPDQWDALPGKAEPTTGAVRPAPGELRALLQRHGGNVRRTAEALGVARTTLYRWVEHDGLDLADFR